MNLLRLAADEGLDVRMDGRRLVVRGPKRCAALAREILARKPEIVRALVSQMVPTEVPFRSEDFEDAPGRTPDGTAPARVCWCCGANRWWKRRGGNWWVCGRCHPTSLSAAEIETWPGEGGRRD